MKRAANLSLQQLCDLVQGELLLPPSPPLGGVWEPILALAACGSQSPLDQDLASWAGAAVWLLSDSPEESWALAQHAFLAGAIAVVTPHAIPPQDGRVTILADRTQAARGVMQWCRETLDGLFGVVVIGPGNDRQEAGSSSPATIAPFYLLNADVAWRAAAAWLTCPAETTHVLAEVSIEKKDLLLYQSVLPRSDFLGIYSLAAGEQPVQQLLHEVMLLISANETPWLSDHSPVLLAPECWVAQEVDHEGWNRIQVASPGRNYCEWAKRVLTD